MLLREFGSILGAVLIALTIRWGVAEAYVIPSGSMLPTLLIHDHIFVNKMVYGIRAPFSKTWLIEFNKPKRGEVIVFKDPRDNNTFLIKRIIGLPGDKIHYHENSLYINDQIVEVVASLASRDLDYVQNDELENQKPQHEHFVENIDGHKHSILHHKKYFDKDVGPVVVPQGSLFVMGDHRDNSSDTRVWGFAPVENILGRAMFVWLSYDDFLTGIRWGRFFHWIT